MLRNVAVIVFDGVAAFELGVLCEVFGLDRPDEPLLPTFDFALCAERPGLVPAKSGFAQSAVRTNGIRRRRGARA